MRARGKGRNAGRRLYVLSSSSRCGRGVGIAFDIDVWAGGCWSSGCWSCGCWRSSGPFVASVCFEKRGGVVEIAQLV